MYIKWKTLPEFDDFLTTIDDSHQTINTTIDDISSEGARDDDCMDAENSSDQPVNETLSDKESMDDDQTVDASSSDNQSVDDATTHRAQKWINHR
jgi:hypothetical protein